MPDDEKIRQNIDGIGNAVTAGENSPATVTNISNPIEKILLAELITIIIIQLPINFCLFISIFDPNSIPLAICGLCITLPIGLNAIYTLVTGIMKRDNKLIILSIISGSLALLTFVLYVISATALNCRVGRC
jgi:hypothetical protein